MKFSGRILKEFSLITVGVAITAAAVFFFMLPSNVSVGSITALAMVLHNYIPVPVSMITLAINVVLLIMGFLLVGPEFGVKTVYGAVMLPIFLRILEITFPDIKSLTGDQLLDTLCYILVVSIGLSLMFMYNASSGGVEIIAKIMNKYLRMDMGKAISVGGMVVALTSALCYDSKTVVLSVVGTYFNGLIVDHFSFGMNIKRKVCILSSRADEILNFILQDLHSGASLYELTGAYDGTKRTEIVTIVDKQEYKALMDYIRKVDSKAFMTIYAVNEINYTPKK